MIGAVAFGGYHYWSKDDVRKKEEPEPVRENENSINRIPRLEGL